jgi:hypothetical protein
MNGSEKVVFLYLVNKKIAVMGLQHEFAKWAPLLPVILCPTPVVPSLALEAPLLRQYVGEIDANAAASSLFHSRHSGSFYHMVFFLWYCSPKSYRVLKQILPIPSISQIFARFQPREKVDERCLTSFIGIPALVSEQRIKKDLALEGVIRGQWPRILPHFRLSANDGHLCSVIPLDSGRRDFPVYVKFLRPSRLRKEKGLVHHRKICDAL